MSGSLPNPLFAGGSGPLATNIYQDKCLGQTGFWICTSFISQLRGARSRKDTSSWNCWSPHCRGSGEWTLNMSFISSILCARCDAWQWPLNKPNHKPINLARYSGREKISSFRTNIFFWETLITRTCQTHAVYVGLNESLAQGGQMVGSRKKPTFASKKAHNKK